MLRTALKPRWLGLFALLLAIMAACAQLGLWQLHVAQDKGLADALRKAHEARPALLDTVIRPHEAFPNPQSNRAVTAIGTYAASDQFLVGPRRLDGRTGYWVVTPLDVTETDLASPADRRGRRILAVAEVPLDVLEDDDRVVDQDADDQRHREQ